MSVKLLFMQNNAFGHGPLHMGEFRNLSQWKQKYYTHS